MTIALVFHLMDYANRWAGEGATVSVEAARRAAAWCEYLQTHAERLYGSAESLAVEGARALLSRISRGDVEDGATIREVYRKQWSRLSTSEEVSAAATTLEDYGWLRLEKVETGGRPTARLRLHPRLRNGREVGGMNCTKTPGNEPTKLTKAPCRTFCQFCQCPILEIRENRIVRCVSKRGA